MKRTALALALLAATTAPAQELKNVQVLKGLTRGELVRDMEFIGASLGVNCDFCHVRTPDGKLDAPNDAKDTKKTARQMMQLVIDTNGKYFKGSPEVSCETCHRGKPLPISVPALPIALVPPRPAQPAAAPPPLPTLDEIISRYAKALGNAGEKTLATMELKGVRETDRGNVPFDALVGPGKVRVTATTPQGETLTVLNGTTGWIRDAKGTRTLQPDQVETLARMAESYRLMLPNEIPAGSRVHLKAKAGDRDAYLVVAPYDGPNGRQRLYFDAETGLLIQRIALTPTPIGLIPQETDFEDYRPVDGTKLPFVVRIKTIDPREDSTRRYSEIRLNAKWNDQDFAPPQ